MLPQNGGVRMSALFAMRYPGRTPRDVLLEYIETHPGCTRNQMRRELASVSHESYLKKLVHDGRVRVYGAKPQRYEVVP